MSLTTLLVLIDLYSDSLNSLPKTSYLKCLDIWFVFSIAFLSAIIAVHLTTNQEASGHHQVWCRVVPKKQNRPRSTRWNNSKSLRLTQILLAVVYILVQIFYWITIYHY